MEAKSKKSDIVVKVILLAIIVLLLIHNCSLMNYKEKDKDCDKNPDTKCNETVIELVHDKKDEDCKPADDNGNNNNNNNNNGKKNNNNNNNNRSNNNVDDNSGNNDNNQDDDDDDELSNEVEVFDKDKNSDTWNGSANLNIFQNSMYSKEGTIAPESTNTYKFVVKNGTTENVSYNITFSETNASNINMKYKLKKNGEYIISDYVSYSDLNLNNMPLSSGSKDTYLLEWKWVSSSNDNDIGKNGATYALQINVEAESN